ncbi:MAG TPA: ABC transporter permease [Vicinamibacterales bacterium]
MDTIWQDVRHAARTIRTSPLFACVSVLSLAIGIAGTAVVFNAADTYLFQPRTGMRDVSGLLEVGRTDSRERASADSDLNTFSYPNFADYRARQAVFAGLAAARSNATFGLAADGVAPVRVTGAFVTANYFSVLGVTMQLGRGFRPEEEAPSGPVTVAVMSDRLWRTSFAADRSIIGRTIRLNGRSFTVIGVTSPSFSGHSLEVMNLWVPLTAYPDGDDLRRLERRGQQWLLGVGRLKAGVTAAQAQSELTIIAADLERTYPDDNSGHGLGVAPVGTVPPGGRTIVSRFIAMLSALAGLILILACANVSGMVLARNVSRTRELALRVALGAAKGRIARLLIVESLLIASMAIIIAAGATWAGIRLLERAIPILSLDVVFNLGIDWRVALFSTVVATMSGVVIALLPAMQATRVDLAVAITREHRTRRHLRMRQLLVVAQIAMCVLLMVCGLLLARSLRHANAINPGFVREGVEVIGLNLQLGGYDPNTGPAFAEMLLARVEALPSVAGATFARVVPLTGEAEGGRVWRPDQRGDDMAISVNRNFVSPGYFRTLGLPLLAGRAFNASDRVGAPLVAVVNETFARRVWPGRSAVGERLVAGVSRRPIEVVGVARDAKYRTIGEGPQPFVYVPAAQAYDNIMWLLIRPRDPGAVATIRALVVSMNPNLPLVRTATLTEMGAFTLFPQRLASFLTGAVAVIGALLAAIGMYGLMMDHVGRRTREIGVRMALGALRVQVIRLVVSNTVLLAAIGATVGLIAASLVTGFFAGILYGVQPLDPVSFVGAVALLALIALAASAVPASRAASVNPVDALRSE